MSTDFIDDKNFQLLLEQLIKDKIHPHNTDFENIALCPEFDSVESLLNNDNIGCVNSTSNRFSVVESIRTLIELMASTVIARQDDQSLCKMIISNRLVEIFNDTKTGLFSISDIHYGRIYNQMISSNYTFMYKHKIRDIQFLVYVKMLPTINNMPGCICYEIHVC
ncbi:MAG: hypothetical protein KDH96_11055 [Candidatus Riesia sp.]|nr:hypothetical protein [Candidatus Riesia sp.]